VASNGVEDGLRRAFVVRVAGSAERLELAGTAKASGASGLAGCVDGNGAGGVVAHPAVRAATTNNENVREENMAVSSFGFGL
jgi:hypothetical protein